MRDENGTYIWQCAAVTDTVSREKAAADFLDQTDWATRERVRRKSLRRGIEARRTLFGVEPHRNPDQNVVPKPPDQMEERNSRRDRRGQTWGACVDRIAQNVAGRYIFWFLFTSRSFVSFVHFDREACSFTAARLLVIFVVKFYFYCSLFLY